MHTRSISFLLAVNYRISFLSRLFAGNFVAAPSPAHVASPPKFSHCAACLPLPFRSSVVATRGRPCSVRRKRVYALPHLPLRLSFLSSPPVTDTTRYQRRVTWFFPPDQFQVSSTLVCRVFLNFRRRVTAVERPSEVRTAQRDRTESERTHDITGARRSPSTIHRRRVGQWYGERLRSYYYYYYYYTTITTTTT